MEVLPCAGVVDRAKQNSDTAFVSNGESSGTCNKKEVQKADSPVTNVEEPQTTRSDAFNGTLLPDCQVESQRLSEDGNDFEDDDLSIQNDGSEALDNHHETVDTIESEPSNNRDSESSLSVPKWLQHDESVAVWVKWRGKWQAGIRCARADWPLSTLRAKPTHDRKKYFVIFFPRTKNYSWADMLLVRSIHEFPQPNACRTHKIGLKMVRDLDVARRFIMKKLLVGILSIVDQFHREALVDTARDIMVWKEFVMEAVRFNEYSDLGRMLLKLQTMIIAGYINPEWLQQSYDSWAQRCQDAQSAEAIELLKEELSDSILWTKVNSLANGQPQPPLGSEWPSWKHDVTKWFSTSDIVSDVDRKRPESPSDTTLPVSRKRAKLEIRRPESQPSTSLQPMVIDTEKSVIPNPDEVRWDGIVVEAGNGNSGFVQTENVDKTPDVSYNKAIDLGSSIRSRQCIAFIEAKGRQCVRWANDGDVYCCVHLTSRFTSSTPIKPDPSPPVNTPMCGGTTVLGNQCKHRALPGSSFCKKHGPRNNPTSTFIPNLETSDCRDLVLVGQTEGPICIGSIDSNFPCNEAPSRYSLYCDKHIPSWLKRARNGKTRIISKEVFTGLLKDCVSPTQKLCLHRACELFYKFFKSIMSLRNPVSTEVQLQWVLSEASKDSDVGEILKKLVCTEKSRLSKIWGFTDSEKSQFSSVNSEPGALPLAIESSPVGEDKLVQCKFCLKEFRDDKELGIHCVENHKKEAQWLFRGQACAICLDSFTNRKLLEAHLQERHRVESVEQCILLQCIHCKSHFGNPDELWRHVLAVHNAEFRMSKTELPKSNSPLAETNSESARKFVCKFCGLKFDLLPDLGRHHQAAHMGAPMLGPRPAKKGIRFYSYRLKSGRLTRPGFKKGPGLATYKIRNRGNPNLKKRIQAAKSLGIGGSGTKPEIPDPEALSRLAESQCSLVAKMLFSEVQKTKPRPNNVDILAAARVACCKASLKALLEGKYGELPQKLFLKAAKLCSEGGIQVQWHQDGYVCPRGCKSSENLGSLSPITPCENRSFVRQTANASENTNNWEVDECHYVIDLPDFREIPKGKVNILCEDISFGKESIPIACVVDEDFDSEVSGSSGPLESFTYVTRPLVDGSHDPDIESLHLGCACPGSLCLPERCDHVYLFDNDFEDAIDVYGKPMHRRFPYDDKGRLILEEGYLVYECNQMCRCDKTCPNRVLQNGLRVKLEVFKTENKGWGVRTCEPILRGTFVCEYIGEVLDEQEANERHNSYGEQGCSYMYIIDAHTNDMSRLIEGQENYVIDATKYGNVSRFINHSCIPNLVNHQVLVDSMESRYAHIGLYASRDILSGEELTHNYRYNLMPGEGVPCHCGTSKCRGRLC